MSRLHDAMCPNRIDVSPLVTSRELRNGVQLNSLVSLYTLHTNWRSTEWLEPTFVFRTALVLHGTFNKVLEMFRDLGPYCHDSIKQLLQI